MFQKGPKTAVRSPRCVDGLCVCVCVHFTLPLIWISKSLCARWHFLACWRRGSNGRRDRWKVHMSVCVCVCVYVCVCERKMQTHCRTDCILNHITLTLYSSRWKCCIFTAVFTFTVCSSRRRQIKYVSVSSFFFSLCTSSTFTPKSIGLIWLSINYGLLQNKLPPKCSNSH